MTPRAAALGVDIFTGLVVASVAVALAGLTWRLTGATGAPAQSPAPPPPARGMADAEVTPILAAAPFGRGTAIAAGAPAMGLGLELKGVILAEPRAASTALIASGGSARSYRIGDTLPGGAMVEGMEANTVLLRVNGRAAILGFPRTAPAAVSAQAVN